MNGDPWRVGIQQDVYLDGSGDSSDPRMRRCGWGVAWLSSDGDVHSFCGGMCGNLGNERHTVAKAELEALVQVLRRRIPGEYMKVWTDCKYVWRGWRNKVWRGRGPKRHADRWKEIGEWDEVADGMVDVEWIKAHVTAEDMMNRGLEPRHVMGNECADAVAKRGLN